MGTRERLFLVFAVAVLTFSSIPVHAQWIEYGIEVCLTTNTQEFVRACSDDEGGAILVWRDSSAGNFDIWAQRVDADGNTLWASNGVPVCTHAANQPAHEIVSDGAGGVIVAFTDYRSGTDYDIYAQRLDPDGNPLWTVNGVPVVTQSSAQMYPEIVTDGAQGAIICWLDYRGTPVELYIQRIDSNGGTQWTVDGYLVSSFSSNKSSPAIAEDGFGGAYVVWSDDRGSDYNIYAQRILNGARVWNSSDISICTLAYHQMKPSVINDGHGGCITAWEDSRSGVYDIYAQRVAYYGGLMWTGGGRPVNTETGNQREPKLVPDGDAGAILAWIDYRSATDEIYAQRVNYLGETQWPSSGIKLRDFNSDKTDLGMIDDGEGGAIISWTDFSYGTTYDVFAQRISPDGSRLWGPQAAVVAGTLHNHMQPAITTDGLYGAIIAWQDFRNQNGYDIYAQRIERNGYWGYPAPTITGIRDIPGDQGGWVRLSFDASRLDIYPEDRVGFYTIWRAIDEAAAMAMLDSGAEKFKEIINSAESALDDAGTAFFDEGLVKAPVIRSGMLDGEPYYWEQIAVQFQEHMIEHHAINLETLFDSTDSSDEYHYFQVIAHESDPTNFWISKIDSARSVDNLAPCPPLCLAGEQLFMPEGLELTWTPNKEADFDYYNIYRDVGPSFDPSPGNLLTTTCDTLVLDGGWTWDSGFCYMVAAVDVHGNESEYSLLCAEQVTGDDPMPLPDATFLAQNYPNPFNPSTTIAFGLKAGGFVNLSIYDAAGRLVAELINESRPAGQYAAVWNGKGQSGAPAASGVYFYRLISKEFEETKKMILLR